MKIILTESQLLRIIKKRLLKEETNGIQFVAYKGVPLDFEPHNRPMFFTKFYDGAVAYGIHKLNGKVVRAIITFKNPLIVNAYKPVRGTGYGEGIPMYKDENGDKFGDNFIGTTTDNDMNEKIQLHGYDGLILNRKYGDPIDGWEVLSFDSSTREFI